MSCQPMIVKPAFTHVVLRYRHALALLSLSRLTSPRTRDEELKFGKHAQVMIVACAYNRFVWVQP
jgi:hypothetical protein